jgi:hypothetical protein
MEQRKMRTKEQEPAEMPDWLLNDIGLRRSDLPRKRRFADLFVIQAPASSTGDWGRGPTWRRE